MSILVNINNGPPPKEANVHISEIMLEKLQIGLSMYMSQRLLRDITVEHAIDASMRAVEFAFGAYVWSNEIKKEQSSINVPKTWWDMFKEAHFPQRLLVRFPIRWRKIDTTTRYIHVCPHLNIDTGKDHDMHIRFLSRPEQLRA